MIKKVKKIKCIKSIKNIKKEYKHIFSKRSIIRKSVPLTKSLLKNMNIKSCLNLVNELNNPINFNIMAHCFFNISKISRLFPPAKNENKFIYGKLIELNNAPHPHYCLVSRAKGYNFLQNSQFIPWS